MSDEWSKAVLTDDVANVIDLFYRLNRREFVSEEVMKEEGELMTEIIEDYAQTSSIKPIFHKLNDEAEMKKFHQLAQGRLNRELPGNYYSTETGRKRFYQMIDFVKMRSKQLMREKVIEFLKQEMSDKDIFMVRAIMYSFVLYSELDLIKKIQHIKRCKKDGQSFEFKSEGQTYAISDKDLVELEDIMSVLQMHHKDNLDKKWNQQGSACLLRRIRAL